MKVYNNPSEINYFVLLLICYSLSQTKTQFRRHDGYFLCSCPFCSCSTDCVAKGSTEAELFAAYCLPSSCPLPVTRFSPVCSRSSCRRPEQRNSVLRKRPKSRKTIRQATVRGIGCKSCATQAWPLSWRFCICWTAEAVNDRSISIISTEPVGCRWEL